MPNSLAEAAGGNLYVANGIDPLLRWDSLQPIAETAGVLAPTVAPVLSGSGLGTIAGTYYAYVRFVDRYGNISNLSPVSAAFTAASTTGTITNVAPGAPIVITSAGHGLVTGDTVNVVSVNGTTGAVGTWVVTVIDANTFSLNGSSDGTAYLGGGTWVAGLNQITYSGVPVSSESKVTRRQLLRNTAGQTQTYYVDVDTTDLTTTSFSSTSDDTILSQQVAVPLFDPTTGAPLANANGIPPNWKSVLCASLARMFLAVDVNYTEGMVAVRFGASTVQGIGTEWSAAMVGRQFYTPNPPASYGIAAVDVANQVLTLGATYGGPTDGFVQYAIRPADTERRLVYFSEANQPESWLPSNALSLQEDGDEITGLMSKGSYLYILERAHIYRLTYSADPGIDGFIFLGASRGCVNNRCWVIVEDYAYMLDYGGVHAFYGGLLSKPVSEPIQDLFESRNAGAYRINWTASAYFHAAHYPGQHTIRWFVALSGSYLPRHALVFDYRSNRWWVEEYPCNVGSSALGYLNGQPNVLLGGPAGRVYALGVGTLDGPDPSQGTVRGTVTTPLTDGFVDSAAAFASVGLVGSPVVLVSGRGKGQRRIVASVSGQTVRVTQPWVVLPDVTTVYQLGGIQWLFQSGIWRFVMDEEENPRRLEFVYQAVDNPASFDALLYLDRFATPVVWDATYTSADENGFSSTQGDSALTADLTKPSGFVQRRIDGRKEFYVDGPRFVSIELNGVTNVDPVTIFQGSIDGVE